MLLSEEVQKWHGGSTYKVEIRDRGNEKEIFFFRSAGKKTEKSFLLQIKTVQTAWLIGSLHSV